MSESEDCVHIETLSRFLITLNQCLIHSDGGCCFLTAVWNKVKHLSWLCITVDKMQFKYDPHLQADSQCSL